MTSPSVAARTAFGGTGGGGKRHSISLGGPSAGELLVVMMGAQQTVGGDAPIHVDEEASGSKWFTASRYSPITQAWGQLFWKVAEGSDVLTVGSNASIRINGYTYRITGHGSGLAHNWANGNSTNSDPPSTSISGSAQDVLSLAFSINEQVGVTLVPSAAPSGYGSLQTQAYSPALAVSAAVAELALSGVTSEDPGTFTMATARWLAATILIPSTAIATQARVTQVVAEVLSSNDDVAEASDAAMVGFLI